MKIKTIMSEYGIRWAFYRALYVMKLKLISYLPFTEKLFEKKVKIKRLNILRFPISDLQCFLRGLPEAGRNDILLTADKAINGVIKGFSSIDLDYGYPINWNYNPITKYKIDQNLKWFRINDFNNEQGDIKVVWEASRFIHFLFFARAFLITDDIKYYNAFSEQLADWLKENQYSYGANFKCGQECSIRVMNALIAYSVFSKFITDYDEANMQKLIEVCYKKVLSNFFYAHKCIKNNHTLSELCGLIIGAWCSEDERKLNKAYKLLNSEIGKQFKPDGGYIQYSFNYQRFALQLIEYIIKISEITGISISNNSKKLIENSSLLMYQCQDQSGKMPNYGSNDGSLIFPFSSCGYHDYTSSIGSIYALITGKKLYKKGLYDEELLWFGNKKEYPYDNLVRESKAFPEAGIYTLRNSNWFLIVFLANYKTRPSHMDGLHIDIWHNGRNILCDSGTYSYADEIGKLLSRTGSHNTLKVIENEQMSSHSNFMIYQWYTTKDIIFDNNMFRGTLVSKNGYEHTREIHLCDNGYQIRDEVHGGYEHCELHFHTAYTAKIENNCVKISDKNDQICTIQSETGKFEFRKSYQSRYYLDKNEICQIVLKCDLQQESSINYNIYF